MYYFKLKGRYYIDGRLEYEGEYLNEEKWNGKGYDENGKINYILNNGNGNVNYYYRNNKLKIKGKYINGKLFIIIV